MNSRTSRPRSPTRPITLTSAAVSRAIMPSSVLLPTPEPAKMPSRWPRPHGQERVDRAHAEGQRLADRGGAAVGPAARVDGPQRSVAGAARRPSIGRPRPSITRPSSAVADRDVERRRRWPTTVCPGRCPRQSPSGISSDLPSRKPTTSACSGGAPVRVPGTWISQRSPTLASGPRLSTTRPISSDTRPFMR